MKGRPALLLAIIFVVGLALGLALNSFFFADPEPDKVAAKPTEAEIRAQRERVFDEADISAEDIELVQGKQGALVWKLLAKTAKYHQEKKMIMVVRPQLTAYFGDDRKEVYVQSDRGEVDEKNDNLTLYDGVTGRFGDLALNAQQLDYVGAIDKVYLKGGVTVRRPDMTLKAVAIEINLTTQEMIAAGGVEAYLAPEGLRDNPFDEEK